MGITISSSTITIDDIINFVESIASNIINKLSKLDDEIVLLENSNVGFLN